MERKIPSELGDRCSTLLRLRSCTLSVLRKCRSLLNLQLISDERWTLSERRILILPPPARSEEDWLAANDFSFISLPLSLGSRYRI